MVLGRSRYLMASELPWESSLVEEMPEATVVEPQANRSLAQRQTCPVHENMAIRLQVIALRAWGRPSAIAGLVAQSRVNSIKRRSCRAQAQITQEGREAIAPLSAHRDPGPAIARVDRGTGIETPILRGVPRRVLGRYGVMRGVPVLGDPQPYALALLASTTARLVRHSKATAGDNSLGAARTFAQPPRPIGFGDSSDHLPASERLTREVYERRHTTTIARTAGEWQ